MYRSPTVIGIRSGKNNACKRFATPASHIYHEKHINSCVNTNHKIQKRSCGVRSYDLFACAGIDGAVRHKDVEDAVSKYLLRTKGISVVSRNSLEVAPTSCVRFGLQNYKKELKPPNFSAKK